MYYTIENAKDAIKRINKAYPVLEGIFDNRPSMTRKEILKEYSNFEYEVKSCRYRLSKRRILPCFETLRHLGLLVVIKEEENHMYSVEDSDYNRTNISSSIYETLPKVFKDMCEETNFLRYHYELTPREIAIERIIDNVNKNLKSLMELAN